MKNINDIRNEKAEQLANNLKSKQLCEFCEKLKTEKKETLQYQYKKRSQDVEFTISNAIKNNWSLNRIFEKFSIVCPKCQELFRNNCPAFFASFPVTSEEQFKTIERDSRELGFTQLGCLSQGNVKLKITLGHLSGIYTWLKVMDEKEFLGMVKTVLDKYKIPHCDLWISNRYLGWYLIHNSDTLDEFLKQWEDKMIQLEDIWRMEEKYWNRKCPNNPKNSEK